MPFRIVLDTLLRISLEEIGISCGSEQTCRRRVILFKFFSHLDIWWCLYIWLWTGSSSFCTSAPVTLFQIFEGRNVFFYIQYSAQMFLPSRVNFFKDRVFATCEWNDWEREREWVSLLIKVKSLWLHNNWNLVALLSGEKAQVLQQMVKFYQTAKGEEKSLCWFLRTDACQQHVK